MIADIPYLATHSFINKAIIFNEKDNMYYLLEKYSSANAFNSKYAKIEYILKRVLNSARQVRPAGFFLARLQPTRFSNAARPIDAR